MSQSVHADFLPDCQRRPATPDCTHRPNNTCEDAYASLGRHRPFTALVKTPETGAEEFYLQVGMQVLCTGELGKWRQEFGFFVVEYLLIIPQ